LKHVFVGHSHRLVSISTTLCLQRLLLAFFRKQQFENQLLVNTWKVKWEDIEPLRSGKGGKDGSTVCAAVKHLQKSVPGILTEYSLLEVQPTH